MSGAVEVFEEDSGWYFRVQAPNGKIVAQSEGYAEKRSAEKGLRALRRALIPHSPAERELNARAWQRGYLFAYYQNNGCTAKEADLKSRLRPSSYLQHTMDALNPYRETTS